VLQCKPVQDSVLQCVAVLPNTDTASSLPMQYVGVCCGVLQCVAECCSVLQCVAMYWSRLKCVGVSWSVLACVAVCCSVLQCDNTQVSTLT